MRYIWTILTIAMVLVLSFLAGRISAPEAPGTQEVVRVDTLTVYDTIRLEKPVYLTKEIYKRDTLRMVTILSDTVLVELPMERKVYKEDSLYRAVVTGYKAELASIEVWPKRIYITKEVQKPRSRWSIGATAGPSALMTPNGHIYGGLGLTAGVTYDF